MSVEDAKKLVARTDEDPHLRERVREAYPHKLVDLGRNEGLDFTREEFDDVLRERNAKHKPPGGGPPHGNPPHGGGDDKPDICWCG